MLRVEVSKNSSTAASSNEGEFDTSTTTAAPASASASPSPVRVLTPEFGRRRHARRDRALAELWDDLRADEPGPADDDDLHGDVPFGRSSDRQRVPLTILTMRAECRPLIESSSSCQDRYSCLRMARMAAGAAVIETPAQLAAITHPTRLRGRRAACRRFCRQRARAGSGSRGSASTTTCGSSRARACSWRRASAARATSSNSSTNPWPAPSSSRRGSCGAIGQRLEAIAEQVSLEHLVEFGERVARDAATLLDRAGSMEKRSRAPRSRRRFASPTPRRAAFLEEYIDLTARLIERYAAPAGAAFTVGLVVHPAVEGTNR